MRFPASVVRLLKTYDPTALRWDDDVDRHAVVLAIVLRGDADARQWLARRMSLMEVRDLIRKFGGAACNEPDRARLRQVFNLTERDLPSRPYLGSRWAGAATRTASANGGQKGMTAKRSPVAHERRDGSTPRRVKARTPSPVRRRLITEHVAAVRKSRLPERLRILFPGYRLEDIRLPEQDDLVLLHVLTAGSSAHKAWLRRRYGDAGIRRWIIRMRGRGLTVAQMRPWVNEATARRWQAGDPYALLWENR